MDTMHRLIAGFLLFLTGPLLVTFLFVYATNSTLLKPEVTKSWFTEENIYNERFIGQLLEAGTEPKADTPQKTPSLEPTERDIVTAFSKAFTPDFVRSQVEGMIDNTHSFASGESKDIKLTLALNTRKSVLVDEIATVLKPAVKKLPVCSATVQPSLETKCRPPNKSTAAFARQIALAIVKDAEIFSKPIVLLDSTANEEQKAIAESIPVSYNFTKWLVILLPIMTALCVAGAMLFVTPKDRIRKLYGTAWYILVNTGIVFLMALFVLWASRNTDFGLSQLFPETQQEIGGYLASLMKNILGSVSASLTMISGIVSAFAILAIVWLGIARRQANAGPAIPQTDPLPPMDNKLQ